MPELHKPAV